MTTKELFDRLGPLVGPLLMATFEKPALCILGTRVVIDVAAYFGIVARPRPVQVLVCNQTFADNFFAAEPLDWPDVYAAGGHSVGIGFGIIEGVKQTDEEIAALGKWNGHLVAWADGVVGDFTIQQAERVEKGIVLGPALVGPWVESTRARFGNEHDVLIEYRDHPNEFYKRSPDWREPTRRKPLVAELIKRVR